MSDAAFLVNATRTPTSALVVSMWYMPHGHRVDLAKPLIGFFETSEKDQAEALVARNEREFGAILMTVDDFDRSQKQAA